MGSTTVVLFHYTFLAGWQTEDCHGCQATLDFSSGPGRCADDSHISINFHHKATFVLRRMTKNDSQLTNMLA